MNCTKCHSDNWKLASVVYSQGLINVETSTSGSTIGVGVGTGGLGVGYAQNSSDTTGSHQTIFSQSAKPPTVPPHPGQKTPYTQFGILLVPIQLLAVGYFLFTIFQASVLFGFVALVFFVVVWGKINKIAGREANYQEYEAKFAKQTEEFEAALAAYAKWEQTRICQRCGTFFVPDAAITGG